MNDEIRNILVQEGLGQPVLAALTELLQRDAYLFHVCANERSITHRFAMYLQPLMSDWDVDCEYNRDGHEPKELSLPGGHPTPYDEHAQTVFPDVIVHKRGTEKNLLVMEFKKSNSSIGAEKDLLKLREFTRQLDYRFALFIELQMGEVPGISDVRWIQE